MGNNIKIRRSAVAGSFYNNNDIALKKELFGYLRNTKIINDQIKPRALIVPHAGYMYSGQTAMWGYKQLQQKIKNQHFVIIGPSHNFSFEGLACSTADFWDSPLGRIRHIPMHDEFEPIFKNENFHIPEHSVEVQIPFLQFLYKDFTMTCFLTGSEFDYKKCAMVISKAYPTSFYIFSSDLSHYLPKKNATAKDKKTIEAILEGEEDYFLSDDNTACGKWGILILLEMVKMNNWQGSLISYENSGSVSNEKDSVVGYAAIEFH